MNAVQGKKTKTGESRVFVYVSMTHTVDHGNHQRFNPTIHSFSPMFSSDHIFLNAASENPINIPIPSTLKKPKKAVCLASSKKLSHSEGKVFSPLALSMLTAQCSLREYHPTFLADPSNLRYVCNNANLLQPPSLMMCTSFLQHAQY